MTEKTDLKPDFFHSCILNGRGGAEPAIVDALLAGETRPRSFSADHGLLVVLRGVNTNPVQDQVVDFIDDIEERVGEAEATMATQDHTLP